MLIGAAADDIVTSDRLTGVKANFLRQSLVAGGYDPAALARGDPAEKGFGEAGGSYKAWRDIWSAGHGVGNVKQRMPAAAIVEALALDYARARSTLCRHSD
jgi:nitronate monooxygenase